MLRSLARTARHGIAVGFLGFVPVSLGQIPAILKYAEPGEVGAILGHAALLYFASIVFLGLFAFLVAMPVAYLAQPYLRRPVSRVSADFATAALLILAAGLFLAFVYHWLDATLAFGFSLPWRATLGCWIATCLLALWLAFRPGPRGIAAKAAETTFRAGAGMLAALAIWTVAWLATQDHSGADPEGTRPVGASGRHNVILIVIDTLSIGHTSVADASKKTTPYLATFAAQSTAFLDVTSSANFTTGGVAALLTGNHGSRSGIQQLQARLDPKIARRSIPAQLHRAGYQTAAFIGNNWAHPVHLGIDSWFDVAPPAIMRAPDSWIYSGITSSRRINSMGLIEALTEDFRTVTKLTWPLFGSGSHDLSRVFRSAERFLDTRDDGRPLFLWVQVLPPHEPYLPPAPYFGAIRPGNDLQSLLEQLPFYYRSYPEYEQPAVDALRDRYDENLMYADAELGRFLEFLQHSGWFTNSVIIVTSDHGESFEKGFAGHNGWPLHQSLIAVPLVVRMPGQVSGHRTRDATQLVDVAATILDVAAIGMPTDIDGRSLLPALEQHALDRQGIRYSMYLADAARSGPIERGHVVALDRSLKLDWSLPDDVAFLYDLDADPNEMSDLSRLRPDDVRRLKSAIQHDILNR